MNLPGHSCPDSKQTVWIALNFFFPKWFIEHTGTIMKSFFAKILTAFMLLIMVLPVLEGQKVSKIKTADLEKLLNNQDNRLYVVNFWATWCAPCVKEMPYIMKVAGSIDTTKVKFVLISLDFPSQIESNLVKYIEKNKISQPVSVMMDIDYDLWINKVDTKWQGDIPATLLFNNRKNKRYFHTGELTENSLRKMINEML
jgi:thiol-disulfide isomerase/thioredoxin